jgi:hypothetical protein
MKKIIAFFVLYTLCFAAMVFSAPEWKEHRSRHFIIYYKNAPQEFVKTVEDSAEDYYDTILYDLGFSRDSFWTWENRAQIYIYDDEKDYLTSSKQASWSRGSTLMGSKTIRAYPTAHGFFDSTLPHELGHIIFREYVGLAVDIPLWLDEGIAMYQEKAKRWGADADVKAAISDGRFIPLEDLSKMRLTKETDIGTVLLFYAEAASVVHYLISELGSFKFSNFCENLKDGIPFDQSLEKSYYRFKSVEDLNKAWLGYLKQ